MRTSVEYARTKIGWVTFVMTCLCLLRFCIAQSAPKLQAHETPNRLPVQSSPPTSGQLQFRNVGTGTGTIQLNGGDTITCGPKQSCAPAFNVKLGESLDLVATAQCDTSYFTNFSLPCSSGGSTTRPGKGECSFVIHWNDSSELPAQMTVDFGVVPPNAKPPIPCR